MTDMLISFEGSSDSIRIVNGYTFSSNDNIERFDVLDENGLVIQSWSFAEVRTLILEGQSAVGGTIRGDDFNDVIESSSANDLIIGGDGSDTYIFEAGDGQDIIDDNGLNDTDVIPD